MVRKTVLFKTPNRRGTKEMRIEGAVATCTAYFRSPNPAFLRDLVCKKSNDPHIARFQLWLIHLDWLINRFVWKLPHEHCSKKPLPNKSGNTTQATLFSSSYLFVDWAEIIGVVACRVAEELTIVQDRQLISDKRNPKYLGYFHIPKALRLCFLLYGPIMKCHEKLPLRRLQPVLVVGICMLRR